MVIFIFFKGWRRTKKFYSYILFLLFLLLFHLYLLLLKKSLVVLMKQLKVLTKLQESRLLVFLFNVLLPVSNDLMILIIWFTALFKINKVNPFSGLTTPFALIFLPNLFIIFKVKLFNNLGKLYLAKGIGMLFSAFFPNQELKDPPDWIILDIRAFLSFISFDILLAKAFHILVVCLVVRNDWCGNYSSSNSFYLILIMPLS